MRLIDADAFIHDAKWCGLETAYQVLFALDHQPHIDIVRCKECKRYEEDSVGWYCDRYKRTMQADDFCSYGEREGE